MSNQQYMLINVAKKRYLRSLVMVVTASSHAEAKRKAPEDMRKPTPADHYALSVAPLVQDQRYYV